MYMLKAAWNLTGFWMCKPTDRQIHRAAPALGLDLAGDTGGRVSFRTYEPLKS